MRARWIQLAGAWRAAASLRSRRASAGSVGGRACRSAGMVSPGAVRTRPRHTEQNPHTGSKELSPDMERLVKATVCLVDGMVCGQPGRSRLERVVGLVGGGRACCGGGGRAAWGWDDAPGRCGSAGRHTDIRGLGPHVGDAQDPAPDELRHGQAVASGSRGSVLPPAASRRVVLVVHLLGRSRAGERVRRSSRPTGTRRAPGRSLRRRCCWCACGRPGRAKRPDRRCCAAHARAVTSRGRPCWRRAISTPTPGRCW
jgi:hypothetical protein